MIIQERRNMTVKEFIEYLQGFPPEEDVSMIVIDASRERKYAFRVEHLSLIVGEAFPQIWLFIDKEAPVDVTREEGEEDADPEQGNESAADSEPTAG